MKIVNNGLILVLQGPPIHICLFTCFHCNMQLSFCFSLPPPKVVLLSDSNESPVKLDLRDKYMQSQNEFKHNTVELDFKIG